MRSTPQYIDQPLQRAIQLLACLRRIAFPAVLVVCSAGAAAFSPSRFHSSAAHTRGAEVDHPQNVSNQLPGEVAAGVALQAGRQSISQADSGEAVASPPVATARPPSEQPSRNGGDGRGSEGAHHVLDDGGVVERLDELQRTVNTMNVLHGVQFGVLLVALLWRSRR